MDPNLARAGAPAPTYTPEDYPLSFEKMPGLTLWLDSLTRVTVQNTPDSHDRGCTCCNYPNAHQPPLEHLERPENWLLKLPCGCSYRRGCAVYMLKGRDDCQYCGFQFFKQWTLRGYVKDLPTADLAKVRESGRDAECGICQLEFSDQHVHPEERPGFTLERPITLPCSHVYGEKCLRTWLSPESKGGGNANTCPSCRKVLFPPWPSVRRDDLADVGLSDNDDDDSSDSSSISSWDDSTVLGADDNAPSRPATHGRRPPMPSVEEEGEEDIARTRVAAYLARQEDIARSRVTANSGRQGLSAPSEEHTAPSHAGTRLRRPQDSTDSDEEHIASSHARRPLDSTGGERPTLSRTLSHVTSNLRTRLHLRRPAASGEERIVPPPPAGRTRLIGHLSVPTPTGATRTRRPLDLSFLDSDEEDYEEDTTPSRTAHVGRPAASGAEQNLSPSQQRRRHFLMEEEIYWGYFISQYAHVQHLNPSRKEEVLKYMSELVEGIGENYDMFIDESPEQRSIRREIIKKVVYEDFGFPRHRRMDRLNTLMQEYEDREEN